MCLDHGVGLVPLQDQGWTRSVATLNLVLAKQTSSVEIHPEHCARSKNAQMNVNIDLDLGAFEDLNMKVLFVPASQSTPLVLG